MSNELPPEMTDLCELIGDLSEGLFSCSYNEDWVREPWSQGRLNEHYQMLETPERERCDRQLEGWAIENNDVQSFLTAKVREAGGWAVNYSHLREDLVPLTAQEKQLCGLD